MADGAPYIAVGEASVYCRNFTVLDANHQHIDPQQTESYTITNWHYVVADTIQGKQGRTIFYGGTTQD